jgi:flagellar protein FlbT
LPLKFSLRPGEKVIVNGAVIGRGEEPGTFYLYNKANFLRGREVMKEEAANTLEKKLYLIIQLMYLFPEDLVESIKKFQAIVERALAERPEIAADLDQVAHFVLKQDYYRALKLTAKLF